MTTKFELISDPSVRRSHASQNQIPPSKSNFKLCMLFFAILGILCYWYGMNPVVLLPLKTSNARSENSESTRAIGTIQYIDLIQYETAYPNLSSCGISIQGGMFDSYFKRLKTSAHYNLDVKYIILPPYLVHEFNWPHYGGGNFHMNTFRPGKKNCRSTFIDTFKDFKIKFDAQTKKERKKGRNIFVVLDYLSAFSRKQYDLTENNYEIYNDSSIVWVKYDSDIKFHRFGIDISMPPAMFDNANRYYSKNNKKKYLVSFKGSFQTHAIRGQIAKDFHDDCSVIIVDKTNKKYDYNDLLRSSNYTLILCGHAEYSFRFTESVCSGAVPVLVTTHWIPPFSEIMQFEEYGVLIPEDDIQNILTTIRNINETHREKLVKNSWWMCENYFSSVEKQAKGVTDIIMNRILITNEQNFESEL